MKKFVTAIFAGAFVAVCTLGAYAQSCPSLSLNGPSDDVTAGQSVTFSVNVSGGDVSPTYNWSVSDGFISSGQGTSSITVETAGITGSSITATVELGGLAPACERTRSASVGVKALPMPSKFDEYGPIRKGDEKARLDNFSIELQNRPADQGYIIIYGGRKSRPTAFAAAVKRIKAHLVKKRGMSADRFTNGDGGYKDEPTTELWIVPAGATPPTPSPTVDPSEVVVTKKPKKKKGKKI